MSKQKRQAMPIGRKTLQFKIFHAQKGLCALCGLPMTQGIEIKQDYGLAWTREHVFSRADFPGLGHHIVLTHYNCNNQRGQKLPPPCLIIYAIALYISLGLKPFYIPGAGGRVINYDKFYKKYRIKEISGEK